jgi:hypothetical protein
MPDERIDEPVHHLASVIGLHVHRHPPRLTGVIDSPYLQMRRGGVVFTLGPIGLGPQNSVFQCHRDGLFPLTLVDTVDGAVVLHRPPRLFVPPITTGRAYR